CVLSFPLVVALYSWSAAFLIHTKIFTTKGKKVHERIQDEGLMATTTTEIPVTLSKDEILRYSRHLIMPEVGMDGQQKLKAARVLCIGTGGLGSPMALYLAAAGVGTLGLVDFDVVDFTNLQRQIIHSTSDVGRSN